MNEQMIEVEFIQYSQEIKMQLVAKFPTVPASDTYM